MSVAKPDSDLGARDVPIILVQAEAPTVPAWEQIENGRYMPRRIRGSCHGRELG
jgi:hypothetical protein